MCNGYMTVRERKLRDMLIPHPPDPALGENEFYCMCGEVSTWLRKVTLVELLPITHIRRAVITEHDGERHVVDFGKLYDNATDCIMRTHDSWEGWQHFRELEEHERQQMMKDTEINKHSGRRNIHD